MVGMVPNHIKWLIEQYIFEVKKHNKKMYEFFCFDSFYLDESSLEEASVDSNVRHTELIQYRKPVGGGPSLKT